jgi:hypothetical protein
MLPKRKDVAICLLAYMTKADQIHLGHNLAPSVTYRLNINICRVAKAGFMGTALFLS